MRELSLNKIKYGGEYHKYFWDINENPNATISNCIANCTTLTYGDCLLDGIKIVSRIVSASNWHNYANVPYVPYNPSKVSVGDVIEWSKKCHVARVYKIENGKIFVRASFYTGIHGKSTYGSNWDTRKGLNSLEECSEFFSAKYPYRMYHETTIETENNSVGGSPDYILKVPTITPVDRNELQDQIEILTDEQNVRTSPNGIIVGTAQSGYYNVYEQQEDAQYVWYRIGDDKWVAGVKGRVVYYPRKDDYYTLYWDVVNENKTLKNKLEEIKKIAEV